MSRILKVVGGAVVIALVVLVVLHWRWTIVHLSQESGSSNASSRAYSFWSGFGSDIGEVVIIGGLIQLVRHHNCHVQGCWRIGRKVDGTPYVACPTHHPAHKGHKRGVSLRTITDAHVPPQPAPLMTVTKPRKPPVKRVAPLQKP